MDTLLIEYMKYGASAFLSLSTVFGYLKAKGVKFATLDKVAEYRQLKEVVKVLTNNISQEEFLAIIKVVMEKKQKKDSITVDDVAEVGKMLFQAVTTEENK